MKFEDKLLKLLNKGLNQGEQFSFKEFKITIPTEEEGDYYIIKNNNKFYLIDAMNHYEMMMESED